MLSLVPAGVMHPKKGKDKLELIKKDDRVRDEHILTAGINQE